MSYGQKFYLQPQGIPITKYRIDQIGCFLTANCNLLERFGRGVDPPTLNALYRDRGIYIDVDDGVRDDLGWQSITAFDGQIVAEPRSGLVTEDNAIVRIKANNSFGTHFCLVADKRDGSDPLIIDSWDGNVKASSFYGPITGWCYYRDIKPQPVQPVTPPPPPAHPYSIENIETKKVQANKPTHLWNLDNTTWSGMSANPVANVDVNAVEIVSAIASHDLGGKYYMPNADRSEGYNIVDFNDYIENNVVAPTPEPVVVNPDAIEVKVIPSTNWQDSRKPFIANYIAKQDYQVTDLAGVGRILELNKGMLIRGVSEFIKDDVTYIQRQKDADANNGTWYGVPLNVLEMVKGSHVGDDGKPLDLTDPDMPGYITGDDSDILKDLDITDEVTEMRLNAKKTLRQKLLTMIGFVLGLIEHKKNKNKEQKIT